jgi:aspartate-semialdehyde dehydrogenase
LVAKSAVAVKSQFDLAVLGAEDPLGEAFLKALEDEEIAVGELCPLTLGDPDATVSYRGETFPCESAKSFDFSRVQALVVTSTIAAAQAIVAKVRQQCPAMPILNLHDVAPGPVVAMTRVLKVLKGHAGLDGAEAFITLPVAMMGKAGVDELVDQSRGLFNMNPPDPEVFPLQIAFNVLPVMDTASPRYGPAGLEEALMRTAGFDQCGISVIWAPLFFGATTALHVHCEGPVDLAGLRLALKRQEGILLMESDLPAGNPTPATDSAESADIFLGQIRAAENDVRIWLVYDPLRLEAQQMVSIVENWIDKPMNSVLT